MESRFRGSSVLKRTLVPMEGEGTGFSIGAPVVRLNEAAEFVAGVKEVNGRRDLRLRAGFVLFFESLTR